MKLFHYIITDNEVSQARGQVNTVPGNFIEYTVTMMGERVFYKLKDGKLAELIAEGLTIDAADRRVDEFLATFNVNLV